MTVATRAWKTAEVAAFLGVSEPTVRGLVREGRLPAVACGRVLRFSPDAVRRFLDPDQDEGPGRQAEALESADRHDQTTAASRT